MPHGSSTQSKIKALWSGFQVEPRQDAAPTDSSYVVTFLALLVGTVALVATGQWYTRIDGEEQNRGALFLAGGLALFVLAYWMYRKRAVPPWLGAISTRLRMTPVQLIVWVLALSGATVTHTLAGNQWKMINPIAASSVWLITLGLVALGSYRIVATETRVLPGPRWSIYEIGSLLALFVFALCVRAIANGDIPHALSGDEGSAGLAAVDILQGRINNPFIVSWFSFPSLYFVVPAISIAIGGQNYEALRMPSAVAGALTVVGLYWFARPLFGRAVAGLGAAVLAALSFHIHFSRIGLNNIWDGFFAVYVLGMFWRGWHTGRRGYFVAAGLLLGLSQYFYTSARILPVIMLAWLAWTALVNRSNIRQRLPELIVMGLVTLIIFLPLGLYFLERPDEFMAPMNRVSIFAGGWFERASQDLGKPAWQLVADNFKNAALAFTTVPMRAWYSSSKPMLLNLPAAFFILGLVVTLFDFRDQRHGLLWLWLLSVICTGALTESTPAGQRYVIGAPVAALFVAISLGTITQWVIDVWPRGRASAWGMAVAVLAIIMALDLHFYFADYSPGAGQGDTNTQVATALAKYLADYPAGAQVFFFGPPRMGYAGFSTVPFLAPQVTGHDVVEALTAPPDQLAVSATTAFVFLPERATEAAWVEQRYPQGTYRWFRAADRTPLFLLYEIKRH
jgi:4-amino-4-deoxy-L-arabinose transferase-like glycosyltransferase